MPNAKVLEQKQKIVADLKEKISAAVTGVVVDYKGINVADDTALRRELRENGVDYFVVKNTLLSRAIADTELEGMQSVLEGTTALALSKAKAGDVVVLAGKGHEDYQILGTGKIHYDEREIVRDILNIK